MKIQVENEIQRLFEQEFVELVAKSPKWVPSLVCVPKKNGDVCFCIDTREANTNIIRNYFPIPTLDEIIYYVDGVRIFSKLDLAQGNHQTVLDEKLQLDIRYYNF